MALTIRLAVTYRADPERVRDAMLAAAQSCPAAAHSPAPAVLLEDFALHGYTLVLSADPAEGCQPEQAASALRFAIAKAFRAAGIEFAVPQSDVRWRDLDFFRQAFAAAAARRVPETNGDPQGS